MNWIETFRKTVFNPGEFFAELEVEGFTESSKFLVTPALLIGGLFGVLALILGVVSPEVKLLNGLAAGLILTLLFPVILLITGLIQSVLMHAAVIVFGKRGFDRTYAAFSYPTGALYLVNQIPFINFLTGLYTLYLQIEGVRKLHGLSTAKALAVVLWPLLLFTFVFGVMIASAILGTTALSM